MEYKSPFSLIKQLQAQLNGRLIGIDTLQLPIEQAKLVELLKRQIVDLRLDIRDYELSETRDEQLTNAKSASDRLDNFRQNILAASEYNIFSSIDVAHICAQLEQVADNLK